MDNYHFYYNKRGKRGPVGFRGATGVTGSIGSTGIPGPTGSTGLMGIGTIGLSGVTGVTGVTGPLGEISYGSIGQTGVTGVTGLPGLIGQTGVTGVTITGATGVNGAIGDTGIAGLSGINGVNGVTGVTGITGLTGLTGIERTGLTGLSGPTGLSGLSGGTGLTGLSGLTGPTDNGSIGLTGPTGARGEGYVGNPGSAGSMYIIDNNVYVSSISSTVISINSSTISDAIWVGTCDGGSGLVWSSDGKSWNEITPGFRYDEGHSVAYGNNMFVATGYDWDSRTSTQWSYDGINWNSNQTGGFTGSHGRYVKFINNIWIALGWSYNSDPLKSIILSPNGSNWRQLEQRGGYITFDGALNNNNFVAYGNGILVTVGIGSNVPNSLNCIQWYNTSNFYFDFNNNIINFNNSLGVGPFGIARAIVRGNNVFVATGRGNNKANTILYSINGINWSNSVSGGFEYFSRAGTYEGYALCYANNMFVAGGSSENETNTILYSFDGFNWSNSVSGGFTADRLCKYIVYNNGLFVAIGAGNIDEPKTNLLYSSNGSNWNNANYVPGAVNGVNTTSLSYINNRWLAVYTNQTLYSLDGSNWSNETNSPVLTSIAYKPSFTPLINIGSNSIHLRDNNITIDNRLTTLIHADLRSIEFNNNLCRLISTLSKANLTYLTNFTNINLTSTLVSSMIGWS
jgi:hypothetical protein